MKNCIKCFIMLTLSLCFTSLAISSTANAKEYKFSGTYTGKNFYSDSPTKIILKDKKMIVQINGSKYATENVVKVKSNTYKVKGTKVRLKLSGGKIRVYASDGRDGKIPFGGVFKKATKSIYFAGSYKKSTSFPYKLEMNKYSSPEGKYVGNYWFVPIQKGWVEQNAEITKIGSNKYREKMPDYTLTFTVYSNKVVVKQKGTVLRGVDFSGTYKLKKRFALP